MELLEEIQYHIKGKLQTCVSSHIGAYEEMLNFINKIEKREQEKPAKESEPAKEIISEIICKECGKEGDLDLEGIWCANCQKYTYSEKPAKENIDLMGQIPIISLANSMFGKPTKEEREWEVGDMVRITKKLINQEDLEIGCEVEVVEYDANDNTWWVEDVFCRYYGWITTEEAELIEKSV